MNKHLRIFFSVVLTCFLICSAAAVSAQEPGGPGETIIRTVENGIKILKDPELQGLDMYPLRRKKLWEAVKPTFDFTETAKRALGPHWLKLSEEQKGEFTNAFITVLKNIYLSKSDEYQGEKIDFVREITQSSRGKVRTHFYVSQEKKVVLDFGMHKVDNQWKVYDIQIEGVSIISNYRSQFNAILAKGTFEELMKILLEKVRELSIGEL